MPEHCRERVSTGFLNDRNLSFRAKGIIAYLLAQPQANPPASILELMEASKEGRDALRAGLAELLRCGYLERVQERHDGVLGAMRYHVVPSLEFPTSEESPK